FQMRKGCLRDEEDCIERYPHHLAPVCVSDLRKGPFWADRRIVDDNVEPAEGIRRFRHDPCRDNRIRLVAAHQRRPSSKRLHRRNGLPARRDVVRDVHNDIGSTSCQRNSDGAADVARRAGDEGRASLKIADRHVASSAIISYPPVIAATVSQAASSAPASPCPPKATLARNFASISARVRGSSTPPRIWPCCASSMRPSAYSM